MAETAFWKKIRSLCEYDCIAPSYFTSKILNISPSAAGKWKIGAMPQASTLKKISEAFRIPVAVLKNDLLELDDESIKEFRKAYDKENNPVKEEKTEKQIQQELKNLGIYPSCRIPVLGKVAAGIPIEQIVDVEDWEDISAAMAQNGEYFALKIHGHSMEPRMCEGDVIIVRRQENVESGETAVVSINGQDATCKKIRHTTDGIMLISTNPQYEPMYYTNKQIQDLPITILGKVVEIRVKL